MNLRAHFFLASAISLHLVACGSTVPPEESDKTASSGSNGTGSTSSSGTTEGTVPAVAAPDPATGNGNGSTSSSGSSGSTSSSGSSSGSTSSSGGAGTCIPDAACGGLTQCTDTCYSDRCCSIACACDSKTGKLACSMSCN